MNMIIINYLNKVIKKSTDKKGRRKLKELTIMADGLCAV